MLRSNAGCLVFLALAVAARAQPPTPAERAAQRLPLQICPTPWGGEDVLCGRLEVPENREQPGGRTISLNVIVIPTLAEHPATDAVFDIDGGPGLASTQAGSWYAQEAPYRQTRDIVLVDQRGMGASNPLHCNLLGDPRDPQNYLREMYPPELVQECREELEQKADLTQYTTWNAARDLEAVREWLGYEQIDIFAISYGGRVAYVYARSYPERVRAMCLLGPADIESRLPMFHAKWGEETFALLWSDCRADPACDAAFPDLEVRVRQLVGQLRRQPANVRYQHPQLEQESELTIEGEIFIEKMRSGLYQHHSRAQLPYILDQACRGNFEPFLDFAIPRQLKLTQWLAEGTYLSITGAEDAPFIDQSQAKQIAKGTLMGEYRLQQQRRAAELWPRGLIPEDWFRSVMLETPTLILQGGRDPALGDKSILRWYRNGRVLTIPFATHADYGDCGYAFMNDFLLSADPLLPEPDCLDDMRLPPFHLGEEGPPGG